MPLYLSGFLPIGSKAFAPSQLLAGIPRID
jgi:hypothetical protein